MGVLEGLADVRFGSLADILAVNCDVRFTPESGHSAVQDKYPLSANSGHSLNYLVGAACADATANRSTGSANPFHFIAVAILTTNTKRSVSFRIPVDLMILSIFSIGNDRARNEAIYHLRMTFNKTGA